MDQIYYTQCPVGYGVGASGGLQVKRHDEAYPLSGDFRHLGLRAFLGTSRTLAPATLRYRRDGEIAEIARLTPRDKEYQTERGLWGRPGGHFAHGLRLDHAELRSIDDFPAALFDWPGWRREDIEPTRGEPPPPLTEGWPGPSSLLSFSEIAAKIPENGRESLPGLLAALASAAEDGRCLFLIDEAERLPVWVEVLTFAFPSPLRRDLTFSTYHDRPEELIGFRLQGTVPAARPNRATLAGLGHIADLSAGLPPDVDPPAWARTLADWLLEADEPSAAAWGRLRDRLARMGADGAIDSHAAWSRDWLDRLFAFEGLTSSPSLPNDDSGWSLLADLATWSGRFGLADEWAAARPADWWKGIEPAGWNDSSRGAFLAQVALRESWRGGPETATAWGDAAGVAFRDESAEPLASAAQALAREAPEGSRVAALRALLVGLPEGRGSELVDRLSAGGQLRPEILLPLQATRAVSALRSGDDRPLASLLDRAFASPKALRVTLDAIASEVGDRHEEIGPMARLLASLIPKFADPLRRVVFSWSLDRGGALAALWLGPTLRRSLADPAFEKVVLSFWEETPDPRKPDLALAVLSTALDSNLGREVFPWAVENLLLKLRREARPDDPAWAEAYLKRVASGYELIRRLLAPQTRNPELRLWIGEAKKAGRLGDESVAQLESCVTFFRALQSGQAAALKGVALPDVPVEDRGPLLRSMLRALGGASFEGVEFYLDACRLSWPDGFSPGARGLRGLGEAIAEILIGLRSEPPAWFDRLKVILDRLRLTVRPGAGFEPDGLAAEVVAATNRLGGDPWPLRRLLFENPETMPLLAIDARDSLEGRTPAEILRNFRRWDSVLSRGGRLFELLLNNCDSRAFAAIICGPTEEGSGRPWATELKTLSVPWWRRPPGAADELRDRFAREVEMTPLPEDALFGVREWMKTVPERTETLSRHGVARWKALDSLSILARTGNDPVWRWQEVQRWAREGLPVGELGPADRRRLIAWMIYKTDFWDDPAADPTNDVGLGNLVAWLRSQGLTADELRGLSEGWADELADRAAPEELQRARLCRLRFVGTLKSAWKQAAPPGATGRGKSGAGGSP